MASNLSCIGFEFADAKAFQRAMIELAEGSTERIGCSSGDYSICRSPTGAEIWFHLPFLGTEDDARDIAGLTPFFEGSSDVEIELLDRVSQPGDNAFEGAFTARVIAPEDHSNGYQITFDAVDFAAHGGRVAPFRCRARLVGFARRLRAFPDDAAMAAEGNASGGVAFASKAFIPIGRHAGAAAEAPAKSTALLTGRVLEHHLLMNEWTHRPFHWLLVESRAAAYDVVVDSPSIEGEVVEGGTVEVGCIMLGRLLGA